MSNYNDNHLGNEPSKPHRNSSEYEIIDELSASPPETESSLFSPSFIALVLSLMVLAGVGSYILMGGEFLGSKGGGAEKYDEERFVSSAQNDCGTFWRRGLRDDTGLSCYLTVKVQRLCQPAERQHLVFVIEQWSANAARYRNGKIKFALSFGADVVVNHREVRDFMQKEKDYYQKSPSDRRRYQRPDEDRDLAFMRDLKAEDIALNAIIKKPMLSEKRLVAELRELAIAGYIKRSDFGFISSSIVKEAFANLPANRHSNCAPM